MNPEFQSDPIPDATVYREPLHRKFPAPRSAEYTAAASIVHTLRTAGYEAYLVGGAVRDLLLGKEPKDYDITTAAVPEQVTALFKHSIPLGASFGVITVVINSMNFEVATFREERDYEDGRRPESLRYSQTPREDVARRDFTVNALLYDPDTQEILDYTGGFADLRAGVIRTIGDPQTRFSEDYLRMLRAVRFSTRFQFTLDSATAAAIRTLAPKLHFLSVERIRDEVTRMLCGPCPRAAVEMLSATGILQEILPEIEVMHGVEQPEQFHPEGDVFVHTMCLLDHIAVRTPEIGWAALLHDVGKPVCRTVGENGVAHFYGHEMCGAGMAEKIMRRLKMPAAMIDHITAAVRNHMRFAAVKKMRTAKLRCLLADPNFPLELELHRLDCIGCHCMMENYLWLLDQMILQRENHTETLPPPLLTGHDLIREGMKPGKMMGKVLSHLRDLQLDGILNSREDALKELKKFLSMY